MGRGKSARNVALIEAAYNILGAIHPANVRAVAYQLFIRRLIRSMKRPDTNKVSAQLRDARELGIVPWRWIVDETRDTETPAAFHDPIAFFDVMRRGYRKDRWTDQPYHVEVWSEKSTVRGTLAPVLDAYGVPFRVMHGYSSTTIVHEIAEQSAKIDKPFRPLYVGDWDASGLHMSEVDLPDRLARYGASIEIARIALTRDHIERLDLPWFSIEEKRHDPRYAWFKARYGRRCWELDALSPVRLREDVERAIRRFIDWPIWNRAGVVEDAERDSIMSILDKWPGISGLASK